MLVSASLCLNYITNLTIPTHKYYAYLERFESNENSLTKGTVGGSEAISPTLARLSGTQIAERRSEGRALYLKEKNVENIMDILSTFQWFLVAPVCFFIHWRFYKSKLHSAPS